MGVFIAKKPPENAEFAIAGTIWTRAKIGLGRVTKRGRAGFFRETESAQKPPARAIESSESNLVGDDGFLLIELVGNWSN